jgi:hypothetical protein
MGKYTAITFYWYTSPVTTSFHTLYSFGCWIGIWILRVDVSEHYVCSIFIGGVSRKNNRDEIPRVSIQVNPVPFILPAYTTYEDGTECSETSAHKIQTPGNHLKERIQHWEHDGSLKSTFMHVRLIFCTWQWHMWSVGSICVHRKAALCEKMGYILILQDGYLLLSLLFLTKMCYNKHGYYFVI